MDDRDKINGHDYVDTLIAVLTQRPDPMSTMTHTVISRCTYVLNSFLEPEQGQTNGHPRIKHKNKIKRKERKLAVWSVTFLGNNLIYFALGKYQSRFSQSQKTKGHAT